MQATYEGALWIGASDLSAEGGFEWSDGAPFRYINWNAGKVALFMWMSGADCIQVLNIQKCIKTFS